MAEDTDDYVDGDPTETAAGSDPDETVPADVRTYDKFSKIEGGTYKRQTTFCESGPTSPRASGQSRACVPTSGPKPASR
jgi:hypothetical protein